MKKTNTNITNGSVKHLLEEMCFLIFWGSVIRNRFKYKLKE
jgi:hypothetical protein